MSKYPAIADLDHVITQTVQFGLDDYAGQTDHVPEAVAHSIAYIASCFMAQHTANGYLGVLTDTALTALQITTVHMSYEDRLALTRAFIAEYGGVK